MIIDYYLPEPKEFSDEELDGFDKLPDKIKTFCHYYFRERRPYKSAVLAGFSKKYAKTIAYKLLRKPIISRYIEYLQKRTSQLAQIDRDYIVLKLKNLIEKEDTHDSVKVSALGLLARMGGFLQDKPQPQTFVFNVIGLGEDEAKRVNTRFAIGVEEK